MHKGHELGMQLRKAYLSFHRRANSVVLGQGVTADQFVVLSTEALYHSDVGLLWEEVEYLRIEASII